MPQALPFAAAVIAKAAVAIGVPMAIAKTAAVLAVNFAVNAALSTAIGILTAPKVDAAGNPTEWTSDPNAPTSALFGEMEIAGSMVRRKAFGPENMYQDVVAILSAAGPIESIDAVLVEKAALTFDPVTYIAAAPYGDKLHFVSQLGLQPEPAALPIPAGLRAGGTSNGWTSAHKLSGKAAYRAVFGHDSKAKIWKRGDLPEFAIRAKGQKCHDPREDSTFPGGSGAQRPDDAATWLYTTNPILCGLKWSRGLWEGSNGGVPHEDTLVLGMGLGDEEIDVASFAECANLSEALGWELTARPTADDDKWEVLKAMLQAGGCYPDHIDGVLTCIPFAAEKSSVATLDRSDIIGPIRFARSPSRLERHNAAFPRYRSKDHRYEMVTADIVERDIYLAEDGGVRRSREVPLPYVPEVEQASSIAAYWVADGREGFVGGMQVKPHLRGVKPGRCFTMPTVDALGPLSGQKLILLSRKFDTQTGILTWGFRAETDAKHTWAGGITGTVTDPVDPDAPPGDLAAPGSSEWTLTAGSLGTAGQLPALFLDGLADNPMASGVFLEYRVDGTSPWVFWTEGDPNDEHYETTNVAPATDYEVSLRFRDERTGIISENRLILGPETTGGLVIDWDDQDPIDPTLLDDSAVLRGTTGGDIGASAAEAADAVERANLGLESDGVVATNKVETPSMLANAVTNQITNYLASAQTLTGATRKTLRQVIITTTGGRCIIESNFFLEVINSATYTITVEILREPGPVTVWTKTFGDTTIKDAGGDYRYGGFIPIAFTETPSAGTYTYSVRVTLSGTITTQEADSVYLSVTEIKR